MFSLKSLFALVFVFCLVELSSAQWGYGYHPYGGYGMGGYGMGGYGMGGYGGYGMGYRRMMMMGMYNPYMMYGK